MKNLGKTIIFGMLLAAGEGNAQEPQAPQAPPPPQEPQAPRVSQGPAKLKLNIYAAYVFDDRFDSYYDGYNYYDGTIKGGLQYGAGFEYMLVNQRSLELLYLRQSTTAPTQYQMGIGTQILHDDFRLDMNYIMLAFNQVYTVPGAKVDVYGGLMAGMDVMEVKSANSDRSKSATKFAWGLKLGLNYNITEKVAIKFQGHMTSPVQAAGGGLYFGTGGAGVGLNSYSTVFQFALGGGFVFKLK